MEIKNFKYTQDSDIDLEMEHPIHGWIPFTASPDDPEEYGRELYQQVIDSGVAIAPYIPAELPDPIIEWRETAEVTRFQAKAALLQLSHLETVQAYMDSANSTPLERLAWAEAKFTRRSQLVNGLGTTLLGLTDEQIDDFFKLAETIEA